MSHYGNISDPLNNCVISFGVGGLDFFWKKFYQGSSHGMSANGKITNLFLVSMFSNENLTRLFVVLDVCIWAMILGVVCLPLGKFPNCWIFSVEK